MTTLGFIVLKVILAIIFVVTSGAMFSKHFRKNVWLVILASLMATTSLYYLFNDISKDFENTTSLTKSKNIAFDFEPQMIHINKGSVTMGSYDGQSDEKPPHRVSIDYDFEIGKYEVTIGQYKRFIEETQNNYPVWLEEDNEYNIYSGTKDNYKRMCLDDDCSIIGVSWNNVKAYVKWLSEKTGKNYRLPSEAEWEYVARAGSKSKWSFGDDEEHLKDYAWYSKNSDSKIHKVGTKKPNSFGVYDMYGNVWEWCEDWYESSYKNTPKNGEVYLEGEKKYKVLRGGSWNNNALNARSADRIGFDPTDRSSDVGFRLLRTLP